MARSRPRYDKTAKNGLFCFFFASFCPLFFFSVFFWYMRQRVARVRHGCAAGACIHAFWAQLLGAPELQRRPPPGGGGSTGWLRRHGPPGVPAGAIDAAKIRMYCNTATVWQARKSCQPPRPWSSSKCELHHILNKARPTWRRASARRPRRRGQTSSFSRPRSSWGSLPAGLCSEMAC